MHPTSNPPSTISQRQRRADKRLELMTGPECFLMIGALLVLFGVGGVLTTIGSLLCDWLD
jgi:hypothetical protein